MTRRPGRDTFPSGTAVSRSPKLISEPAHLAPVDADPAFDDLAPEAGGYETPLPAIDLEALAPDERAAAIERVILTRLDDDKAQEVVHIDLRGKSSIADAMIVASGRSHRHVGAMADHLLRSLKDAGHGKARVEGLPACDWVLIDAGDVIVHLFRPEVRAFYNIEKIWSGELSRHHIDSTPQAH
jgi:ribosome-associated protein